MSQTLRIIIASDRIEPWPPHNEAVKNFINEYAYRLTIKGNKVLIVTRSKDISLPFMLTHYRGVTYLILRTYRFGTGFHESVLDWVSSLWSADIVHFFGRPDGYSPRLAKSLATFLTIYEQDLAQDPKLAERISKKTTLIVESDWLRALVNNIWQRKAYLIYPGIDLSQFTRRPHRLHSSTYHAVFASSPLPKHDGQIEERYLKNRGVPEVIAISHFLGQQIDFETTLLWRKEPTRALELIGQRQSVRVLHEYVSEMDDFLNIFDFYFALFKDTTLVKAIPQSVVECLAKGIPAICSQDSELSKLLSHYGAALSIPSEKPAEAASEIIKLLNDSTRYDNMSIAAWQLAQKVFDISSTTDKYITLYQK